MAEKTVELFQEILPSDRLNAYQYFSSNIMAVIDTSDPGTIWEHLRFNPWVAMAIYDDMEEKDAAVYSALDSRKTNVLSKPRVIIPASSKRQDRKIADFVEECLTTNYFIDFEAFLSEALEALPKGVSIGEIIWANASDRAYIEKVNFKPQQLFAFGATGYAGYSTATLQYPQTGNLRLRDGVLTDTMAMGAELPEDQYKFFVF